jgi:RTX calcium-binding nonapeptide repeat (4 copies)
MRRLLAPAVVLCTCLVGVDVAEAATLSRDGDTIVFTDTANENNTVYLYKIEGSDAIFVTEENWETAPLTDDGSGCQDEGAGSFSCTDVAALRISAGGGDDAVHNSSSGVGDAPADVPMSVDGGEGGDFLNGGPKDDDMKGGPGPDGLSGHEGSDTLDGGFGADYLEGGEDGDVVTYAARIEAIGVDFTVPGALPQPNGSSNDGPPGARDHIRTVETVIGGSGNDTMKAGSDPITFRGGPGDDGLTGSPGTETLIGGDGADTIDALGGSDTVLAGAGTDTVEARDGFADIVDCGPDSDNGATDAIDEVTSCGQDPGPAGPPAPTIVTVTLPSRVLLDLSYTYTAGRRSTKLSNVTLDVERGARLTVTCRTTRGKRCPRTKDLARTAAAVRLKGFERRALPVGAKLTIRATNDGAIGVVKTLTMRKRKAPSLKTQCIPAGSAKPGAC